MQPPSVHEPLTPESIPALLATAQTDAPAAYYRLMELYCVVKAGGLEAQRHVAERLLQQETAALHAEIAALNAQPGEDPLRPNRLRALHQEIEELRRSVAHRLAYLDSISAEEAAIVARCLPTIDAYFLSRNAVQP